MCVCVCFCFFFPKSINFQPFSFNNCLVLQNFHFIPNPIIHTPSYHYYISIFVSSNTFINPFILPFIHLSNPCIPYCIPFILLIPNRPLVLSFCIARNIDYSSSLSTIVSFSKIKIYTRIPSGNIYAHLGCKSLSFIFTILFPPLILCICARFTVPTSIVLESLNNLQLLYTHTNFTHRSCFSSLSSLL